MPDKRRNVRITHRDTVRINAEGKYFEGQSIDISRTGMQIVVTVPETDSQVRSISFTLPQSQEALRIPVRLARQNAEDAGRGRYRLGLEFDFEAEEQILLIEQYIRDLKNTSIQEDDEEHEARTIPRTDCDIRSLSVSGGRLDPVRIANVSTEGLLLRYNGELSIGQILQIEFAVEAGRRPISATASVVYVVEADMLGSSTAGLRFVEMKEIDRSRLRNFIVDCTSSTSLRLAHLRNAEEHDGLSLTEPQMIRDHFARLSAAGTPLYILLQDELRILASTVLASHDDRVSLQLTEEAPGGARSGSTALCSFAGSDASYRFTSEVISASGKSIQIAFPTRLDRSEKRSYQRKPVRRHIATLSIVSSHGRGLEVSAAVVDISWRGFLCEFVMPEGAEVPLRAGQQVAYSIDKNLGLGDHGQVRHITESTLSSGETLVHVGIEAMVTRSAFVHVRIGEQEWNAESLNEVPDSDRFNSVPVRYTDDKGRPIAALVSATRMGVAAPVVVIPPAFGKKKEGHAPLVATLLENARRTGRDLVTVRFDGINRPGESFNESGTAGRGYEMLRYRPSQDVADIQATLDYIRDNPLFEPTSVVLITASMSSVAARKLLAETDDSGVDAWLSLMGVPAAQRTLSNILAGTDIVADAKAGVSHSVRGMLGHLVDLDALARDLIDRKFAYLTDARHDMAQIHMPTLWICGAYDRWVAPEEVSDLMSVDAGAERRLLEIPTGHNLRASDDALKAFKLASEFVHRISFGEQIDAVTPARSAVLALISEERERLVATEPLPTAPYWAKYLLGGDQNSEGYDFYGRLPEFRDFLDREVALLDPADGDCIADLGCGTGLLTESLLSELAGRGAPYSIRIVAADLVQEALEQTRAKCDRVIRANPHLSGCSVDYVCRDLCPNRMRPVKELMANPQLGITYLHGRIEGLRADHVRALDHAMTPELLELLCGTRAEGLDGDTLSRLPEEVAVVVREISQVARYLSGSIGADSLSFETLRFGAADRRMGNGFRDRAFDKVIASLVLSYLLNPDYALSEIYRTLKPGGRLVLSSMKPDSDVSKIFTEYVASVRSRDRSSDKELKAAEEMLNEAAGLFELEEEGFFTFYSGDELASLLQHAGFKEIRIYTSLGTPPQAVIATGVVPM